MVRKKHKQVNINKINKYINFTTSHRTIKTSLKSIVKYPWILPMIENAINRMNKIVIHTLQFIKLYYLDQLFNYNNIVSINKEFINCIMKVICVRNKKGRKCSNAKNSIMQQLKIFFNNNYKQYMLNEHLSYTNLNTVMDYETINIETVFKNHIINNFSQYMYKYINDMLDVSKHINDIKNNITNATQQKLEIRHYRKEIRQLKNDILNTTNKCNIKYNNIKNFIRTIILPQNIKNNKSLIYNVHTTPLMYLPTLIYMSIQSEINGKKPINCFPLRKNTIPKYITLDTTSIIHLLINKETMLRIPWLDKKSYYTTKGVLKNNKKEIWNYFFKINKKCFKKKGYCFKYMINTDGIGCSILLIRNDLYYPTKKMLVRTVKKPKSYMECPYINKISDTEKEQLKTYNVVGIDPGKQDLLYCTNGKIDIVKRNNGKSKHKITTFRYSQNQRRFETKSKKYKKIREQLKKNTLIADRNILTIINKQFSYNKYINKISIKQLESLLCNTLSKSCLLDKVKDYIKKKSIIHITSDFYKNEIMRKLKWYTFINTQKSESKLINNFKKKFGNPKKTIVCIGDWSNDKQMKYQEPTKGKSFRKLFKRNGYKTYLVDEYNTSKKSYINGEDLEKFKKRKNSRPHKNNIIEVHGLLRSKSVPSDKPSKVVLFNRDVNGCLNIRKKAIYAINNKKLPKHLTRIKQQNQQDCIDEIYTNVSRNDINCVCGSANLNAPLQVALYK